MTNASPTLVVNRIVKRHGQREILAGISMTLAKGAVGVLIGPSGSGKSTLLRCVNGLEVFQSGEVVVDNELRLAADMRPAERQRALLAIRRKVGMVFQQFNLFPHLTALGNVIEAPINVLGKSREQATDDAARFLNRVGLAERLHAMPHQLSGGQQQRVAIARTLAMEPEVILFDEPTSALDPKMTGEVLAVMTDLATEGQTMLVVTHAMNFARKVATDVHVLDKGTIAESGSPDQVFGDPRHDATRELLRQAETTG